MIDWFSLFANSLWILGLAVALATFSYASWQASILNQRTRLQLMSPGSLTAFSAAGLLFCAGLAATSDRILEVIIWSILGILFLVQGILVFRGRHKNTPPTTDHSDQSGLEA